MPERRIRFVPTRDVFHIEGGGDVLLMDRGWAFGPFAWLSAVSLASLRSAMLSMYGEAGPWREWAQDKPRFVLRWSMDLPEVFEEEGSSDEPVAIGLMPDGTLVLEVDLVIRHSPPLESDRWMTGEAALREWAASQSLRLLHLGVADVGISGYWTARFGVSKRGRTVGEVAALGKEAEAVASAHAAGEPSLYSLVGLLREGYASSLIGLSESTILEAKNALYLADTHKRLELAKDVAGLANSPSGGLIVFGLSTKSQRGSDRVVRVTPIKAAGQVRRVTAVVHQYLFPPVEGLEVLLVPAAPASDERLLVVIVPPQPSELRPFLVSGALVDEKVEGAFISIVHRRGEDTLPTAPASIHAALTTGYALLRSAHSEPEQ